MSDARIQAALADWTRLYEHLAAAQARLNALRFDTAADKLAMTLELARLLRESEEALKAIQLQIDLQSAKNLEKPPAPTATVHPFAGPFLGP